LVVARCIDSVEEGTGTSTALTLPDEVLATAEEVPPTASDQTVQNSIPQSELDSTAGTHIRTATIAEAKPVGVCDSVLDVIKNRKGRCCILLLLLFVAGSVTFIAQQQQSQEEKGRVETIPTPQPSQPIEPSLPESNEHEVQIAVPTSPAPTIQASPPPVTNFPTIAKEQTPAPTTDPLEQYIAQLLPNITQLEIQKTQSAQSEAFHWIVRDVQSQLPEKEERSDEQQVDFDYFVEIGSESNATATPTVTNSLASLPYSDMQIVQRFALATLYHATKGIGWKYQRFWLSRVHECQWFSSEDPNAVQSLPICNSEGEYTRLVLQENRLIGTLPPEISLLTNLEVLILVGDNFFSNPDYLLQHHLPSELGLLTKMQTLHISKNSISGSIPSEFALMSDLRVLRLFENELTGGIPPEILMSGCQPNGSPCTRNLHEIRLYDNLLSNTIPTEIGLMTSLVVLDLYRNQIQGTIPSEIGKLTRLTLLDIQSNRLRGSIPTEIGLMRNLEFLKLSENNLNGHIPSEMGKLRDLFWLLLKSNRLEGPIPTELGFLHRIRWFLLLDNALTSTIPSELGGLSSVQFLEVYDNLLTGRVPSEICHLQETNILFLLMRVDCNIDCPCPRCICQWL
jgi:Leucine-rich repeat (LRR) protein